MEDRRSGKIIFALACGLYFAFLQFSYFFLLEAFLSSQYLSYFVTLLFWLGGFLLGLNFKSDRRFPALWLLGLGAYYVSWILTQMIPFSAFLYPAAALCSVVSGLLPGYFFTFMSRRVQPVRSLLFHENNGFLIGIFLSLQASIHMGRWFLAYSSALGAILVGLAYCLAMSGLPWKEQKQ